VKKFNKHHREEILKIKISKIRWASRRASFNQCAMCEKLQMQVQVCSIIIITSR